MRTGSATDALALRNLRVSYFYTLFLQHIECTVRRRYFERARRFQWLSPFLVSLPNVSQILFMVSRPTRFVYPRVLLTTRLSLPLKVRVALPAKSPPSTQNNQYPSNALSSDHWLSIDSSFLAMTSQPCLQRPSLIFSVCSLPQIGWVSMDSTIYLLIFLNSIQPSQ